MTRFYSSVALPTTLASSVTSTSTAIVLVANTGLPTSYPFTLLLEWGTTNQEVVTITQAPTGSPGFWTFSNTVRGEDSTTGVSHTSGASAAHGVSARDFQEPQTHIDPSSPAVHGLTGSVVGTTDAQTLSNKNFTTPVIGSYTNAGHNHTNAVTGGAISIATDVRGTAVGQFQFDRKTASTNTTNISGLDTDPHLSIALVNNATYVFELFMMAQSSGSSQQMVYGIGGGSITGQTTTFLPLGWGGISSLTSDTAFPTSATLGVNGTGGYAGWAAGQHSLIPGAIAGSMARGIIRTLSSGTLKVGIGSTLNSSSVTFLIDSWLSVFRWS